MVDGFLSWVQKLDRFGHEVSMHYLGDRHFKTMVGSIVTVVVYTLIMINTITIGLDYLNNENQTEINRVIHLQPQSLGPIDLIENKFNIVAVNYLPPEIGHIRMQRTWIDFDAQFDDSDGYI